MYALEETREPREENQSQPWSQVIAFLTNHLFPPSSPRSQAYAVIPVGGGVVVALHRSASTYAVYFRRNMYLTFSPPRASKPPTPLPLPEEGGKCYIVHVEENSGWSDADIGALNMNHGVDAILSRVKPFRVAVRTLRLAFFAARFTPRTYTNYALLHTEQGEWMGEALVTQAGFWVRGSRLTAVDAYDQFVARCGWTPFVAAHHVIPMSLSILIATYSLSHDPLPPLLRSRFLGFLVISRLPSRNLLRLRGYFGNKLCNLSRKFYTEILPRYAVRTPVGYLVPPEKAPPFLCEVERLKEEYRRFEEELRAAARGEIPPRLRGDPKYRVLDVEKIAQLPDEKLAISKRVMILLVPLTIDPRILSIYSADEREKMELVLTALETAIRCEASDQTCTP